MRWKTLVGGILGVATMMVLAGCGPSTASEPAGEVAAPEGETAPVATEAPTGGQAAGACANVFYPVVDGATWTYDGSVDPIGPYTYTETVTEVQPDGFTLSGDFGEVTRLQEWSCTAEGLIAVDVPGGGSEPAPQPARRTGVAASANRRVRKKIIGVGWSISRRAVSINPASGDPRGAA